MPKYDKGKQARQTRQANYLDKVPKDRTKSRPNPKAKFKQRSGKRGAKR